MLYRMRSICSTFYHYWPRRPDLKTHRLHKTAREQVGPTPPGVLQMTGHLMTTNTNTTPPPYLQLNNILSCYSVDLLQTWTQYRYFLEGCSRGSEILAISRGHDVAKIYFGHFGRILTDFFKFVGNMYMYMA